MPVIVEFPTVVQDAVERFGSVFLCQRARAPPASTPSSRGNNRPPLSTRAPPIPASAINAPSDLPRR